MHSIKITREEIERHYGLLRDFHEKFLKKFGVKLPKLQDASGQFTKDGSSWYIYREDIQRQKRFLKQN